MTTQKIALTSAWQDITALAALVVDSTYLLKNGATDSLYLFESLSVPGSDELGPKLQAGIERLYFKQAGETLYARVSDTTKNGTLFIDNAI